MLSLICSWAHLSSYLQVCKEMTVTAVKEQRDALALQAAGQPVPEPSAVAVALAQQHLRVLQALPPLVVLGNTAR